MIPKLLSLMIHRLMTGLTSLQYIPHERILFLPDAPRLKETPLFVIVKPVITGFSAMLLCSFAVVKKGYHQPVPGPLSYAFGSVPSRLHSPPSPKTIGSGDSGTRTFCKVPHKRGIVKPSYVDPLTRHAPRPRRDRPPARASWPAVPKRRDR